jgi:hypothetical protein
MLEFCLLQIDSPVSQNRHEYVPNHHRLRRASSARLASTLDFERWPECTSTVTRAKVHGSVVLAIGSRVSILKVSNGIANCRGKMNCNNRR